MIDPESRYRYGQFGVVLENDNVDSLIEDNANLPYPSKPIN